MAEFSDEHAADDYRSLDDIVAAAWAAGGSVDLSGVTYGRPHWDGPPPTAPYSHYRFLAGLVRQQGAARILEIGTHFGGSALAMCRGMTSGTSGHVLTIDVELENIEVVRHETRIQRFQGHALHADVIAAVAKAFHHLPVDLIYVDADHEFFPTLAMVSIYCQLLKPQYVVLDDINLNDSMRDMWRLLAACHPGEALDATHLLPEMQAGMISQTQGFGIIRLR